MLRRPFQSLSLLNLPPNFRISCQLSCSSSTRPSRYIHVSSALWKIRFTLWISSQHADRSMDGIGCRIFGRRAGAGRHEQKLKANEAQPLLIQAGFLRQAHSGVFHLLPLGLRVQDKLERLIDKHMNALGASKLSLSSISSEELWQRSGRLEKGGELLRIKDRKESGFLLSPTHEEEITTLVGNNVHSYKDFPLRLYQISRKYRDERRPRQGLLRAKEFLMKDLYTFDYSEEMALNTYENVRKAYSAFFEDLKLPFIVANADSGNMGGDLSHEYHFLSSKGEDNVIVCDSCDYVANEELAEKRRPSSDEKKIPVSEENAGKLFYWTGINYARNTLYRVWTLKPTDADATPSSVINFSALKRYYPDIDLSVDSLQALSTLANDIPTENIYDSHVCPDRNGKAVDICPPSGINNYDPYTSTALDLAAIQPSDPCPKCSSGKLSIHRAIEVGHTFHLGTRYSKPLEAYVQLASDGPKRKDNADSSSQAVPLQMGCHGIGISRLIGATASLTADEKGLNWPVAIAPYHVVVVPARGVSETDATRVYDKLGDIKLHTSLPASQEGSEIKTAEVLFDDRADKDLGWKLKDADLVGYPVTVVLGRAWKDGKVEVQCRRLKGFKEEVEVNEVAGVVAHLLRVC